MQLIVRFFEIISFRVILELNPNWQCIVLALTDLFTYLKLEQINKIG